VGDSFRNDSFQLVIGVVRNYSSATNEAENLIMRWYFDNCDKVNSIATLAQRFESSTF